MRNCKYDIKKSKNKLKRFLETRNWILEKMLKIDSKKVELILDHNLFCWLPYRDKHGNLIAFCKPSENIREARETPAFIKMKDNECGTSESVNYSVFYEGVSEEFRTYAERELNETEEKKVKGMQKLRKLLEDENISNVDESILVTVMRNCKYDIKKSKDKLKRFLKTRSWILEEMLKIDSKKVELIMNHGIFTYLPYRDKYGRLVAFCKPSVEFDRYNMDDVAICFLTCAIYMMTFPMTSLTGVAYIGQAKADSFQILYEILKGYKNYTGKWLDFPLRLRKMDVINENFLVRWFFAVVRPIVPSKLYKRVSLHGDDLKSLHKVYHPDLLPEELGGTLGPMDNTDLKERLINFVKQLRDENRTHNGTEK